MTSDEGGEPLRHMPVGLTITAEKIDRILAEVQSQFEMRRRERTDLGLVRGKCQHGIYGERRMNDAPASPAWPSGMPA